MNIEYLSMDKILHQYFFVDYPSVVQKYLEYSGHPY